MIRITLATLILGSTLSAQDPTPDGLWYLENGTHLVEALPGGSVVARIDLQPAGIQPLRAFPAPDGRIWLVTAGVGQLHLLEPDDQQVRITAVPTFGETVSPASVQFSANKNAWVVYRGGILQEFLPTGDPVRRLGISAAPVVDMTFDHAGILWVAHSSPGGLLSRVDIAAGITTEITLQLGGERSLVSIRAAPPVTFPGGGFTNGALWLTDDSHQVLFADLTGTLQSSQAFGVGFQPIKPTIDRSGQAWITSPSSSIAFVLAADGKGLAAAYNFLPPARVTGFDVDPLGRILVHLLDPSNQTRIELFDPASGATRSRIELGLVSSTDPSRWYHALVTNRLGDSDGDGWDNLTEIRAGTSPWDAQSEPGKNLLLTGPFERGATATIFTHPGPMVVAVAAELANPAAPLPGIEGRLRISLASLIGAPVLIDPLIGFAAIPIPDDPALVGRSFFVQGVRLPMSGLPTAFTSAADLRIYR